MNYLSKAGERRIEAQFAATHDALRIFKLVVGEWSSDPMSVQCFDLRIVEDAKRVHKQLKQVDPFY